MGNSPRIGSPRRGSAIISTRRASTPATASRPSPASEKPSNSATGPRPPSRSRSSPASWNASLQRLTGQRRRRRGCRWLIRWRDMVCPGVSAAREPCRGDLFVDPNSINKESPVGATCSTGRPYGAISFGEGVIYKQVVPAGLRSVNMQEPVVIGHPLSAVPHPLSETISKTL